MFSLAGLFSNQAGTPLRSHHIPASFDISLKLVPQSFKLQKTSEVSHYSELQYKRCLHLVSMISFVDLSWRNTLLKWKELVRIVCNVDLTKWMIFVKPEKLKAKQAIYNLTLVNTFTQFRIRWSGAFSGI